MSATNSPGFFVGSDLPEPSTPTSMDRPGERWEGFVSADDGTRLYARERRGAPGLTALLCDGIACDGFIWRYLLDDLLAISSVLHWNYRGHGRSSAPVDEERIDIQAFVDDLEAVRRSRLREPAILFGHSMGCQLVLEGYRRRPQGIVAMVLICGAPGRMTHSFKGSDALARALPGVIERVRRHPHLARALWSNVPPHVAARLALAAGEVDRSTIEPEDLVRYSEHVAGLDLLMFLRMLHACGEASAEDMLAEVSVPTLVIAGASDSFTPPRLAEAMAAQLPDSELLMVPGATHVVPIERREEVRERIFAFVRERVLLQR